MERAVRKPRNAVMIIALVMLCLVMASSYLVAGMLARYSTKGIEDDNSRVAKFDFRLVNAKDPDNASGPITQIVDLSSITKPGDSAVYFFNVSSQGEVAVEYRAKIQINGSMPLKCTLSVPGSTSVTPLELVRPTTTDPGTNPQVSGEITGTATSAGTIFKLNVEWPADAKDLKYASGTSVGDVVLTVTGTQID